MVEEILEEQKNRTAEVLKEELKREEEAYFSKHGHTLQDLQVFLSSKLDHSEKMLVIKGLALRREFGVAHRFLNEYCKVYEPGLSFALKIGAALIGLPIGFLILASLISVLALVFLDYDITLAKCFSPVTSVPFTIFAIIFFVLVSLTVIDTRLKREKLKKDGRELINRYSFSTNNSEGEHSQL